MITQPTEKEKAPIVVPPSNIYQIEDCLEEMLYDYDNGKRKGTTTHNAKLDQCWTWRKEEFNIWSGYANEGKALDIETLIPTPNGLTFMRDLQVGDTVFDEKGMPCKVTNVTDIMYDRPCYKVAFSDGTFVVADGSHQWVVDDEQTRSSKSRQAKRSAVLRKKGTDQRSKTLKERVLTTEQILKEGVHVRGKANFSIDLCQPIQYDKQDLLTDPYLLGVWLGDGSKDNGQITSADPEILEAFKDKGFVVTKHVNKYSYGILKFKVLLRKIGVLKNKHIPWEYLFSCVEDRLALLQGLMDTDGFTDKLGRCEYTCVDWHLTEHVHLLLTSLGIKVYRTEDSAMLNGKVISPRYRLRFKTSLPVFRLGRKLERQLSARRPKNNCRLISSITAVVSVPVKCIEVDSPNHMYLCTEHCIPTHNSLFIKQLCMAKALGSGWKFAFCSPEDYPPAEFFDDMIHTLAGMPTDRDRKNRVPRDVYHKIADRIKDYFYFVYIDPPDNTIESVLGKFKKLLEEGVEIDAFIIDPLLKFARPKGFSEKDDVYAAYVGSMMVDFARKTRTSTHLVMHQVTPRRENGKYPEPSMYSMKGGGSWADGCDNVLTVWRPNYATDKTDDEVEIHSQKIKKQKLVGIPQRMKIRFNRVTNRYVEYGTGTPLFDFENLLKV